MFRVNFILISMTWQFSHSYYIMLTVCCFMTIWNICVLLLQ